MKIFKYQPNLLGRNPEATNRLTEMGILMNHHSMTKTLIGNQLVQRYADKDW